MTLSGPAKPAATMRANERLALVVGNIAWGLALFGRTPRAHVRTSSLAPARLAIGATGFVVLVAAIMIAVDAWAIDATRYLPEWVVAAFDRVTDFGRSPRLLVPLGIVLALIAVLASPVLTFMARGVLAALAVRLMFLICAIGIPGLAFSAIKRLIGRARPLVEGTADPFLYRPLGWSVEYASLPSGHAIDAFAIAAALGALWPRARPLLWTYAAVIAVSRVLLTAHFPSDVFAGAAVGIVGALLVREWFAARGLAFKHSADGLVKALPGPSLRRLKKVAEQLLGS